MAETNKNISHGMALQGESKDCTEVVQVVLDTEVWNTTAKVWNTTKKQMNGQGCSGIFSGLVRRRSGVRLPDLPTLEKCAMGIHLATFISGLSRMTGKP